MAYKTKNIARTLVQVQEKDNDVENYKKIIEALKEYQKKSSKEVRAYPKTQTIRLSATKIKEPFKIDKANNSFKVKVCLLNNEPFLDEKTFSRVKSTNLFKPKCIEIETDGLPPIPVVVETGFSAIVISDKKRGSLILSFDDKDFYKVK